MAIFANNNEQTEMAARVAVTNKSIPKMNLLLFIDIIRISHRAKRPPKIYGKEQLIINDNKLNHLYHIVLFILPAQDMSKLYGKK